MTKALLLGTSALVAAGLFAGTAQAADPIEIKVGGFMNQWFGYQDNDISNVQDFDQWSNSEIIFNGKTTLDNGLTVGLQVQLEANTSGDQIDESFAFVEGSFGRFVIGSENSAAYLMQFAAPNVGLPINSGSQTQYIINNSGANGFRSVARSTFIEPAGDNDGQKITYFTPRFSGFQFGVSYLPDVDTTGGDRNSLTTTTAVYHDGFSAGLNYVESFSGFDVAAAAGYYYASAPDSTTLDDFNAFSLGLNVGFGGFTVGGSYANITDGVVSGTTTTEGQSYDVGVSYETGALGFSLTYMHGETDGDTTIAGDIDNNTYEGSVSYALGAGVKLLGSIGYADFNGEIAGTSADDNDGVYVATGLALSF